MPRTEDGISPDVIQMITPILKGLRQYHDYEIRGIENIPSEGRGIIACNHSLATYDIALLFHEIYDQINRIPRPLADHLFFKIPYLGGMVEELGAVDGVLSNAKSLLEKDELVGVAPGGMREALRPSSKRYQIFWNKRKGFARLAMETQSPVIVAVCPRADDLYHIYENPLTSWAYRKFKLPFFLARGIGFSPLPRKIKLIHHLGQAIYPPIPKEDPAAFKRQLARFHKKIVQKTEELMEAAIAHDKSQ